MSIPGGKKNTMQYPYVHVFIYTVYDRCRYILGTVAMQCEFLLVTLEDYLCYLLFLFSFGRN